jgi:hypothetical protein
MQIHILKKFPLFFQVPFNKVAYTQTGVGAGMNLFSTDPNSGQINLIQTIPNNDVLLYVVSKCIEISVHV